MSDQPRFIDSEKIFLAVNHWLAGNFVRMFVWGRSRFCRRSARKTGGTDEIGSNHTVSPRLIP
jgi:hypothetical protein